MHEENHYVVAVATGLALVCASPVAFGEEEENLNASDVPTVVQQAAEKVASGGKIVRWEKEGKNYEAVIEMNGKEWGYKFDATANERPARGEHGEGREGRALRAGE